MLEAAQSPFDGFDTHLCFIMETYMGQDTVPISLTSAEYAKTKLYKTANSSVSVGALTFTTVQLQLMCVTQPRQGDNYTE